VAILLSKKESIDTRILFHTICIRRNLRAAWLLVVLIFLAKMLFKDTFADVIKKYLIFLLTSAKLDQNGDLIFFDKYIPL